jgi:hypothetical protein
VEIPFEIFKIGVDFLGLTSGISFSDLTITSNSTGTSTLIKDGNTTIATIANVDDSLINASDFVAV